MGSDSGPPGANALELVRMVDGGLTPLEGVVAATSAAAAAVGLPDAGTVEPGKRADLLVVDGDVTADLRALCDPARIHLVLRDGTPVAGSALAATGALRRFEPPCERG
jgi:imidazolonepropionase-like amidohydrolase